MAAEHFEPTHLDGCACCTPRPQPTLYNPPGAPSLRYRIDTHGSALAGMLAELSRLKLDPALAPTLERLTTRASSDPAIALLDAWAVITDILTFYQERIANEGFLGTSQERRSIHELAAMIGYQLKPGVAASTQLAFTIEAPVVVPVTTPGATPPNAANSPAIVPIATGTKVQSTPGPGELPQTFETVETIEARVAWNAIRPLRARRQQLAIADGKVCFRHDDGAQPALKHLWLETTSANLMAGDWLVVEVAADNQDGSDPVSAQVTTGTAAVRIGKVEVDQGVGRTRVRLLQGSDVSAPPDFTFPARPDAVPSSAGWTLDAATVRSQILERRWAEADLCALIAAQRWDAEHLLAQVGALLADAPPPASVSVLRQSAAAFGAVAPRFVTLPEEVKKHFSNWDLADLSVWKRPNGQLRSNADLYLDRVVEGLAPGGFVLLTRAGQTPALFAVRSVVERTLSEFAISGKVTGLKLEDLSGNTLSDTWKLGAGAVWKLRSTTVRLLSQPLPVGDAPLAETIGGPNVERIISECMVLGLRHGQALAVSGNARDLAGADLGPRTELTTLHHVAHQAGRTILRLDAPLAYRYERASFAVCANLARATHGETVLDEQLGSGDGSAHQARVLKRPPLTRVSAPTASGTVSTLDLRVDGVSWREVESLLEAGPRDRVYQVRSDDAGKSTITFGDGVHGVRPPTGRENVSATYRTGMGRAGEVAAGKLTLLGSRPLGVRGVVNPDAASGAEDPEPVDAARSNALRTVRTLDRIVSLTDFEDFARGFAGIAKARGVELWDGHGRLAHLTIAGFGGAAIAASSELYRNLLRAIADLSDGIERFAVQSFVPHQIALEANLLIAHGYRPAHVLSAATELAAGAYAFAARELAQPVTEAEVVTLLSAVPGVTAVKVTRLHRLDRAQAAEPVIAASDARWNAAGAQVDPAELLTLLPANLRLTAVSP